MSRPTQIAINLAALRHNYQQVKRFAPNSKVLVMVKSNGYGHGIVRIAEGLQQQADAFGVACIEEGMLLRAAGIKNPIVLMEGLFETSEISLAIEHDFTLVVHHADQITMLENISHSSRALFSVWLKINTGMHRLGFDVNQVHNAYTRLMQCVSVKKPIGLMTHFAESDGLDKTTTSQQAELFRAITDQLEGPRSLANSAAILAWPATHADWVRPGIMMYGVSPFATHPAHEYNLQPVMTLQSRIIAIHQVTKGQRIGYAGTWTCPEDMLMGVVGIGYGDGYPWRASNCTSVLLNHSLCPIVGRVAMDMLTIDLRSQPQTKLGDSVLLWGPGLSVEEIAEKTNTSPYELLTRITQRVHVVIQN